jgi:hypothetical protein
LMMMIDNDDYIMMMRGRMLLLSFTSS